MERTTYQTKQELINAICREYADFLDFNIQTMTFDEYACDTIYRKSGKVCNSVYWLNNGKTTGKYLFICTEMTSHIISVDDINSNNDNDNSNDFDNTSYVANHIKRIISGEADDAPDGKYLCYLIDYDSNTAEKINGSTLLNDLTENSAA